MEKRTFRAVFFDLDGTLLPMEFHCQSSNVDLSYSVKYSANFVNLFGC